MTTATTSGWSTMPFMEAQRLSPRPVRKPVEAIVSWLKRYFIEPVALLSPQDSQDPELLESQAGIFQVLSVYIDFPIKMLVSASTGFKYCQFCVWVPGLLTPAMYSLTFLSAQQLVQDEDAICEDLACIPWVVYDILFRVAFKGNKKKLLCELVKTWPYSQLKFQKLMQTCGCCSQTPSRKCPECQWPLTYDDLNKNKIGAILLGVLSYIRKVVNDGSWQLPHRSLRQLDMTGLVSKKFSWNLKLMRLWANSVSRAQIHNFSHQETNDSQSQAWSQTAEAFPVTSFPMEAYIDILVDLQVSPCSLQILKEALQNNANSPLHLTCRDFYTSLIFVQDNIEFLALLNPLALRRVDLSNSIIVLMDIWYIMSLITTFQNLQSLKLPSFNENEQWEPQSSQNFAINHLAKELSKLRHLREITLSNICLSNQVKNLLSGLQCSLKSLQLSYCSLTNQDIAYLARSHHSTHLIKLDLEGNNISTKLDSFLELLKSVSNSLKWLSMAKCGLKDTDFYIILTQLHSCSRLSYLCLYGNPLSSRSMFGFLGPCQHKLLNLKVISVPIFLDCCQNLPQNGPLPELLQPYIDDDRFSSALKQMKEIQIIIGQSATIHPSELTFDTVDFFDLQ
ncbi:leucine-rich repeat-containing protein 14-like [Dromiciops gliroides]|uniref:leucine-rich repeat-containing protein 14-like n=1 Tax=Dromiciops gliroides TaxID=33562 RepID=UPI001CC76C72|nr:leucine-rich repeat-containing protein 14-like [Dromiciops gliroides]